VEGGCEVLGDWFRDLHTGVCVCVCVCVCVYVWESESLSEAGAYADVC
jgi:hypothetical protein